MTRLAAVALTWVAIVLAIVLVDIVLPQRFGPTALGEIFEPYLVLTGLLAGIVGIRAPNTAGRALVVALLAIALARYVPAWLSFPPVPAGDTLRVSTLNIEDGPDAAARALDGVSTANADLVAIEELGPQAAAAFANQATFDFLAFPSDPNVLDIGLLSHYPILETQMSTDPPFLRAVIDPLTAEPIVVYVIHAPLGRFITMRGISVSVDLSLRDSAIARIRARVAEDLLRDRSVIVLGDFNTTEREPAYTEMAAGIRDSHLDAGVGPGFTWRPAPLADIPFGMLRIDYVLSTADLVPTSSTVDCRVPSDHCRLDAELDLTRVVTPD